MTKRRDQNKAEYDLKIRSIKMWKNHIGNNRNKTLNNFMNQTHEDYKKEKNMKENYIGRTIEL